MNLKTSIRVAAYLLVYLGVPIVAGEIADQTVGTVLGIVYLFLLIPFGLLKLIDFYRTNDGATLFRRIFNALFRVPLALFSLVCLLAGFAIIAWVLYNIIVERQKDYSGPRLVVGLGSFGVGVPLVLYGWFTLRSVVRRREQVTLTPEEQEEFEHEVDDEDPAAEVRRQRNERSEEG